MHGGLLDVCRPLVHPYHWWGLAFNGSITRADFLCTSKVAPRFCWAVLSVSMTTTCREAVGMSACCHADLVCLFCRDSDSDVSRKSECLSCACSEHPHVLHRTSADPDRSADDDKCGQDRLERHQQGRARLPHHLHHAPHLLHLLRCAPISARFLSCQTLSCMRACMQVPAHAHTMSELSCSLGHLCPR